MVKIKNYFVKNYKRVEKSASKSMKISHFCNTIVPIEPVGCEIKFLIKSKIVPLYPLYLIYAKKKFFGSPLTNYSLGSYARRHYSKNQSFLPYEQLYRSSGVQDKNFYKVQNFASIPP